MAANRLWVGLPLEQLGGTAVHSQLRFENTDPLACRDELGLLRRGQPRLEPTVDAVLAAPRVDRLVADSEIVGDLGDLAPSLDQIEHATPKLRRVAPSPHAVLLQDSSITFQLPDSTKAPADQSLYRTRGSSRVVFSAPSPPVTTTCLTTVRESLHDHARAHWCIVGVDGRGCRTGLEVGKLAK
jgi:hypothetical protein